MKSVRNQIIYSIIHKSFKPIYNVDFTTLDDSICVALWYDMKVHFEYQIHSQIINKINIKNYGRTFRF